MASDYRTGRTYVMFNYNSLGWHRYRTVAQGYRVGTEYRRLFTSYRFLSYLLPSIRGNTGNMLRTETSPCYVKIFIGKYQKIAVVILLIALFYEQDSKMFIRQCVDYSSSDAIICMQTSYSLKVCSFCVLTLFLISLALKNKHSTQQT